MKGRSAARVASWRGALGGALLAAASGLACGPSYQALYEGDARFEHCYALEETSAAMGQKRECWHDWTDHYTYGQTRDRVEYAYARYGALSRAPVAPTDEAMMEAAPGEGRASAIAAPAPTSAFAPPPKVLTDTSGEGPQDPSNLPGYIDAGADDAVRDASLPEPTCSEKCGVALERCRERQKCEDVDGGRILRRRAVCETCTNTYAKCKKGC
ncbi:MAG TPA: hypothetical protein VGI39_35435 [Polyangiaceae bacterium]|jgi:hypothetical protein